VPARQTGKLEGLEPLGYLDIPDNFRGFFYYKVRKGLKPFPTATEGFETLPYGYYGYGRV